MIPNLRSPALGKLGKMKSLEASVQKTKGYFKYSKATSAATPVNVGKDNSL